MVPQQLRNHSANEYNKIKKNQSAKCYNNLDANLWILITFLKVLLKAVSVTRQTSIVVKSKLNWIIASLRGEYI